MAHIDLDHAAAARRRPAATAVAFHATPARTDEPARPRPALPRFCRINAGQFGRSLLLVLICVGFWQIPRS